MPGEAAVPCNVGVPWRRFRNVSGQWAVPLENVEHRARCPPLCGTVAGALQQEPQHVADATIVEG